MIKFVIFLSLVVFTSGHTASISESSKQKRSIFDDARILSPISSYGHGYPWTRSKNLLKVLKIPSELPLLPPRSIVSYGSAVRPPSPLVVTKHIFVEKQIPVPGKPVIYEKQVPIHFPVHVPVKVPVERFVPVTVEKSVPVPVPQLLPYPVERQVPVRQNVPYPVPIIITTQIAQAPQPTSQPQTLQLAPQPTSPPQTFQIAAQPSPSSQVLQLAPAPQQSPPPQVLQLAPAPQQSPPPQLFQLAQAPQQSLPPQLLQLQQAPQQSPPPQLLQLQQAPQQSPPPQLLQLTQAPQDNPAPQIFQLAQAPQPTLATPNFSQLQSSLARQPSDSRPSILPISFSVNAGISAGVQSAPQLPDFRNFDLSSLAQLSLLQAPPSPQPLQSNDLGSPESLWGPEEFSQYSDLYSK